MQRSRFPFRHLIIKRALKSLQVLNEGTTNCDKFSEICGEDCDPLGLICG